VGEVRHLVWDWNGTLFDDVGCSLGIANELLAERNLPALPDVAAYRAQFGFPIIDYYRRLGIQVDREGEFERAAHRYHELYAEAMLSCGLHEGATVAMDRLARAGVDQLVVSAAAQDHLDQQVQRFEIRERFSAVLGVEDVYAAGKSHVAEAWLTATGADPDTVLFVGDSEHDYEIAAALGARCVLYSGGHHARDHLEGLGVPVIDTLAEVPRYAT